ncbi:MAG: single-stranded DNA-binding protein [Candidatus Riflebacteria bacterium]|nr:single-stranded DNA-binding protein [Candidatus Riflebacteria bacterium]
MSGNLNKVFLMGNLVRDPELRSTGTGTPVAQFDIAVNRSFKGSDGEFKKETEYFKIIVWGKSGENCAKYLTKGKPVLVEGRLQVSRWEKDGQKQSRTEIVAENVQFLGSGASGTNAKTDADSDGAENFDTGPDDDAVPF